MLVETLHEVEVAKGKNSSKKLAQDNTKLVKPRPNHDGCITTAMPGTIIDVKVKMAGVLFREFNRFTEVQEIAHQVLKMQPKNSEILVLMGRVREKFEKPMEALEYYQSSIEVLQAVQPIDEKSLANSYFLLGQIHEKLKDFKKCAMSLKKCLTYDKRHFGACILLANLLASIGEGGRALKYF